LQELKVPCDSLGPTSAIVSTAVVTQKKKEQSKSHHNTSENNGKDFKAWLMEYER
jgi:hypothetical protein